MSDCILKLPTRSLYHEQRSISKDFNDGTVIFQIKMKFDEDKYIITVSGSYNAYHEYNYSIFIHVQTSNDWRSMHFSQHIIKYNNNGYYSLNEIINTSIPCNDELKAKISSCKEVNFKFIFLRNDCHAGRIQKLTMKHQVDNDDDWNEIKFFEKLWKDRLFADFTFHVGNQKHQVHKNVLGIQSEIFRTMFECDMLEKSKNEATINDISAEGFACFLEYLYTRKKPSYHQDTILNVYKAAHKYEVKKLLTLCEVLISENIKTESAFEMLEFATIYESKMLIDRSFNVIKKNVFPELTIPDGLKKFPEKLQEIFKARNEKQQSILKAEQKYDAIVRNLFRQKS